MFAILVYDAWTVEELLILFVITTLSARLLDRSDDVVRSAAPELPGPRGLRPIIIAAIAVIITSFFAVIIVAMRRAVGASSPGNVVLVPLVGLFGVGVLVGSL